MQNIKKKLNTKIMFNINHNDIGILYLIFGIYTGIIGTLLSFLMRLELSVPGESIIFLLNYQFYNTLIRYQRCS